MDRRRLVAATVVVALLALAGCNGPVPRTEVVCDGCVAAVEETADATGRSIVVEGSVTHVYLRESGGARVEARMTLSGADADDFRANDTLLASVRDAVEDGVADAGDSYGYDDGYGYDGSDLAVTFRAPNVSQSRLGATLSTYFYRADGDDLPDEVRPKEPWSVGTDRLVVHGPEGTEPLLSPERATRR